MPLQWQAIEHTKRGIMFPLRIQVMVNFMNPSRLVELVWFEKILRTLPPPPLLNYVDGSKQGGMNQKKRVKKTFS